MNAQCAVGVHNYVMVYPDEDLIAREAHERAKTGHWIDVRYSMSKAIDIIDDL
jgi:hypothetical protein